MAGIELCKFTHGLGLNQFKISEGGKWNSHQMPCVYSSRNVKKYRICPIRIEIIHGRHRVVQIWMLT
jgi:RES domain-containing protein